jgi:hypothetical protein
MGVGDKPAYLREVRQEVTTQVDSTTALSEAFCQAEERALINGDGNAPLMTRAQWHALAGRHNDGPFTAAFRAWCEAKAAPYGAARGAGKTDYGRPKLSRANRAR